MTHPSAQELRRLAKAAERGIHRCRDRHCWRCLSALTLVLAGYTDSPVGRALAERVAEAMEILERYPEVTDARRALAALKGETT